MKKFAALALAVALGGCSTAGYLADAETGGWVHYARTTRDLQAASAVYSAETASCGQNVPCLQGARLRYQASVASVKARPSIQFGAGSSNSETVYSVSECVGAVVMGQCHGSILPNTAYHATCHGEMLNGQCTGPMF